jgi:hypothetical protein
MHWGGGGFIGGVWWRCAPGGGACVAAVALPYCGGMFTCEGGKFVVVMVGSRSKRDRYGNALVGGALPIVRRHCGLLGNA